MAPPAPPSGAYIPQSNAYEKDNTVWVYTAGKWREGIITGKQGSSGQHYNVKLVSTQIEEPYDVDDMRMRPAVSQK